MSADDNVFRERYGPYAIVTGASGGLGEAFAHALAARGVTPILVARREDELARVAAQIAAQYGLAADTIALDLADQGFIDQLLERTADRDVGLVIGNAAYNPAGAFPDMSRETLLQMLHINDRANLLLANGLLPRLRARGKGGFLMLGSTESFIGMPYSACYAATKAFVMSLGEALWLEYAEFGVDVLVLAPGAMDTPLLATRKLDRSKVAVMPPLEVATIGLDNIAKGPVIVPGKANQQMARFFRFAPRRWMLRNIAKHIRATFPSPSQGGA